MKLAYPSVPLSVDLKFEFFVAGRMAEGGGGVIGKFDVERPSPSQ